MDFNIVIGTDSYKLGHWPLYPMNTDSVYSYFEARTGAKFSWTVFAGLQPIMTDYLEGSVVTQSKIDAAARLAAAHFGNDKIFNREGWEYILHEHGGRLPVKIRAVPEGTPVPNSNVLMTVENLDPKCWWLTNHLETILTHVWYSSTVATLSRKTKEMMKLYMDQTANDEVTAWKLPYMLHDFGYRGTSSIESAGMGGMAHLVNFKGTDTIRGIEYAMEYYNSDVCGESVIATEHSVMCSLGPEGEWKIFKNAMDVFPTGVISIVGDSYDIFRAAAEIVGEKLHDQIMNRDGVFVLRPDSGDPTTTVIKLLKILDSKFEGYRNPKGFKVLNDKVRLIWGDGVDYDGIYDILREMKEQGWSAENIVFGMGGGLLQRVNRDTQRFAFKCCAQQRDGEWCDIYKDPIDTTKVSKKGRLSLVQDDDGNFRTVKEGHVNDILETVFENGEITKRYTFDEVRKNAEL